MKLSILAAGTSLALGFGTAALAADTANYSCSMPMGIVQVGASLPGTAAALRRGDELVVVAIGSSSTSGTGASNRARTYPARLQTELRRIWPDRKITVINKGIGGEEAQQMVARFERDVLSNDPDLVIWQAGTNLMLRSGTPETLVPILRSGIRRLRAAGIDVILMDPQFAPKVTDIPAHRQFVSAIAQVTLDEKIGLFHRFALMRYWVESDALAVNDIIANDKLHMNDVSYTCVARALATGIKDAVERVEPPVVARSETRPTR